MGEKNFFSIENIKKYRNCPALILTLFFSVSLFLYPSLLPFLYISPLSLSSHSFLRSLSFLYISLSFLFLFYLSPLSHTFSSLLFFLFLSLLSFSLFFLLSHLSPPLPLSPFLSLLSLSLLNTFSSLLSISFLSLFLSPSLSFSLFLTMQRGHVEVSRGQAGRIQRLTLEKKD